MNDVRSRLPVAPIKEQHPIQNTNSTYANEIVPKNEKCTFFILQGMRLKQLNSQIKEGKIHLKPFPGTKANQRN